MKLSTSVYKAVAMLAGGVAGFFYWISYGCTAGCALTGTWYGSVIIGGVFGNLFAGLIVDIRNKQLK